MLSQSASAELWLTGLCVGDFIASAPCKSETPTPFSVAFCCGEADVPGTDTAAPCIAPVLLLLLRQRRQRWLEGCCGIGTGAAALWLRGVASVRGGLAWGAGGVPHVLPLMLCTCRHGWATALINHCGRHQDHCRTTKCCSSWA